MEQARRKKKHKKRSQWVLLAPLMIFIIGAGIFSYPAVSNFLAEKQQREIIHTYEAKVKDEDTGRLEAAWEEAVRYNENLAGDPVHDPFIVGSGYILPDNYETVLNISGDGVMGYLEIPKIDVYIPVYHGTSEEVLQKGAGHLEATALPIGGNGTRSVISAHRGLPSAELFTRLDEMENGDVFYIHVLDKVLAYETERIEVIEPQELQYLVPENGKDLVTLLTCTPYAVNTHRLLVTGTRVPYEKAKAAENENGQREAAWVKEFLFAAAAGLCIFLIIVIVILIVRAKKRGKRNQL